MSPGSKFAARLRKLPVLVGLATNAASFFAYFFFFFTIALLQLAKFQPFIWPDE